MLELTEVVAQYGPLVALRGVDLQVRKGEITCLLGGNAAGKSSMMKTIVGLLRPTSGTVVFEGNLLNRLPPRTIVRGGIALVPEGRRIFARMTVLENLIIGAYIRRRRPRTEIDSDIEHVYGLFPRLRERVTQIAGTMSGGEQQMLAIGRALMARPRLLLLDEPSMGLSPAFVDKVFDVIQEINR
jgi:branched-chain amino acid transport system ATP-binding protein